MLLSLSQIIMTMAIVCLDMDGPLGVMYINELSEMRPFPLFSSKHLFPDSLPALERELRPRIEGDFLDGAAATGNFSQKEAVLGSPSSPSGSASSTSAVLRRSPMHSRSGSLANAAACPNITPVAAFDLDVTCLCGRLCLLFNRGPSLPQVWLFDLGCQWHFVANSFTDYFRLLIMHLGIPNWQYIFTDCGLDSVTQQWMRLFSPQRLQYNLERIQMQREGGNVSGLMSPPKSDGFLKSLLKTTRTSPKSKKSSKKKSQSKKKTGKKSSSGAKGDDDSDGDGGASVDSGTRESAVSSDSAATSSKRPPTAGAPRPPSQPNSSRRLDTKEQVPTTARAVPARPLSASRVPVRPTSAKR
eukprot:ANDGO_02300.mRNA.2 hypothetical protein GUITHDRAFT_142064